MKSFQQKFWPDAQPLVDRLGADFFRTLPETPGVYFLRGADDCVLYVGKAKNLRRRLCSYRVANADRMSRRTLRLLVLVQTITWLECADESAALRQEGELLRTLRPRFNRAGVWVGPPRFLLWQIRADGVALRVADSRREGWECLGSFGSQAMWLRNALVRLLWSRFHPRVGLCGMPLGWFEGAGPVEILVPQTDPIMLSDTRRQLGLFAAGDPAAFQPWLGEPAHPFTQKSRADDAAFLKEQILRHLGLHLKM